MKKIWRFTNVWALALAGLMLLAGPALAQTQGGGPGGKPADHGGLCTGGPGGTCRGQSCRHQGPTEVPHAATTVFPGAAGRQMQH